MRVVLVRPKASANVGAAARAMKNFGLGELVLVRPRCRLDREAYALASHAGDVLDEARIVSTLDEALADRTFVVGTSARARASESVPDAELEAGMAAVPLGGAAVLFGPEDHGLANTELDRCQLLVHIRTAEYASINLAQAVNLVAYAHFARPRPAGAGEAEAPEEALASRDQVERMYAQMVAMWHLIGFTDANREEATLRLFRGFLERARLRPREVAALRGLWSQAAWAAERDPERLPGRS